MNCWREQDLDSAAIRLLDAGVKISPFFDRTPWLDLAAGSGLELDLPPLLQHAARCVRCWEILVDLQETEAAHREILAARSTPRLEPPTPGRVFRLIRMPSRSPRSPRVPASPTWDREAEEFAVAAQSADSSQPTEHQIAAASVLNLTSEDSRYVVRIFPNRSGTGATALLLPTEVPAGPDSDAGAPPRPDGDAPGPRIVLRVQSVDYPFDEHRYAHLPTFPVYDVTLIIREKE